MVTQFEMQIITTRAIIQKRQFRYIRSEVYDHAAPILIFAEARPELQLQ